MTERETEMLDQVRKQIESQWNDGPILPITPKMVTEAMVNMYYKGYCKGKKQSETNG